MSVTSWEGRLLTVKLQRLGLAEVTSTAQQKLFTPRALFGAKLLSATRSV